MEAAPGEGRGKNEGEQDSDHGHSLEEPDEAGNREFNAQDARIDVNAA
ncbi:MAG: hypothetical protein ACREPD_01140 [Stenotrophomonas sp.]